MIVPLFLAFLVGGPLVYRYGKRHNSLPYKYAGALFTVLGLGYLAWAAWSLMNIAG